MIPTPPAQSVTVVTPMIDAVSEPVVEPVVEAVVEAMCEPVVEAMVEPVCEVDIPVVEESETEDEIEKDEVKEGDTVTHAIPHLVRRVRRLRPSRRILRQSTPEPYADSAGIS